MARQQQTDKLAPPSEEPKLHRLGIRTDLPINSHTQKVIRSIRAILIVGTSVTAGLKTVNYGLEKLAYPEHQLAKEESITNKNQLQLIDAPRHNYQKDFVPTILQTTGTKGETVHFCALNYQGKNLELITGVHFMEMSNEARRYGIDLKIGSVEGQLNNVLQLETELAISWVKKQGLLFGFTPLKDSTGVEVRSGLFEFNRDQATKDFLALPDNLKPSYAEGCVFGFIQQLKMPDRGITIPFSNQEFTNYFTSAGLVHGFIPSNFQTNKPETTYTYSYEPEKAHQMLTALSSERVNSFKFTKLQGTLWKTIDNQFPYLSSAQVSKTVELTIKLNTLLDRSFNPNRLNDNAQIIIPDLRASEAQEILKLTKQNGDQDSRLESISKTIEPKPTEKMSVINLAKLCVSKDGLDLIKTFESFRANKYLCQAGVPTIGYGCTRPTIVNGPALSEKQAVAVLSEDLSKHVKRVENLITTSTLKQLTPNQFAALVSFDFNTGALDKSTLCAELNKGNKDIGAYLCLFNKVRENGTGTYIFSDGLFRRRLSEMLLYYGANGKDSYVTPETYNNWAKSSGRNPNDDFKNKAAEKMFVALMIKKAQTERLEGAQVASK